MPEEYSRTATMVERILWYVENGDHVKASALARLGDELEDAFQWEVSFDAVLTDM